MIGTRILNSEANLYRHISLVAGVVLCGVAIALTYLTVTMFEADAEASEQAAWQSDRIARTRPTVTEENLRLRREVEEVSLSLETLEARIQPDARDGRFLTELTRLSDQSGVVVHAYQPIGEQEVHHLIGENVRVQANGSFPAICRFLFQLHEASILNRIRTIRMVSQQERRECQLELGLQVFRKSESTDGGNLPTNGVN